ncbi:autotransporter domain-containing protein [Bradyrhizobium lablabi]|nr:autotransporter domain-containing protein [Bradyrhizobium lablabi]
MGDITVGSALRRSAAVLLATTALGVVSAHAVDGTWTGAGNDWIDGTNWSSTPNVPDGTATFTNNAAPTGVDVNGLASIGALTFTNTAPAYTINTNDIFLVNGAGVNNASAATQTFNVFSSFVFQNASSASTGAGPVTYNNAGFITFANTSTAGNAAINNGSVLQFFDTSAAGTATIQNNLVMDFFDGASAGSANITNAATGTLTLNSTATAGSATIVNSGTVSFTGLASGGTGSANLVNNTNGLWSFNDNSTAGAANVVNLSDLSFNNSATAGTATVTTSNGATTRFTGTSTGGNARFITSAGGTFNMSGLTSTGMTAGSIEGAGNYVLGSKTLTTGGNNASTTVDGVISGAGGGLTKVGTGTMTLTNTNTYSGETTISGGTLALSGSGWLTATSRITVDATFDISAMSSSELLISTLAGSSTGVVKTGSKMLEIWNGSTEFGGSIQDTGGLRMIIGTQTLSGNNTYTGTTQIYGGTLALKGSGSISSSVALMFLPFAPGVSGTFDISQTNTGASVRSIHGSSNNGVVALGGKTLTITGGNATFDGVIQDGGIGGGTGGNLTIATVFAQKLSGVNTYTGATTIVAGGKLDLISAGGHHGSIATSSGLTNNGTFDVSALTNGGTSIKSLAGGNTGTVKLGANTLTLANANGAFAGVIQGSGGLTLSAGAQVLSGANTYTGNTNVNSGTLVVDGSTAASALTTVNGGATLAGSGNVGTTVINGGTLAAGSAGGSVFGPLAVAGSLTFTAASTYLIQVSPATAGRTNVTGAANLGGATVNAVFQPGSYVNKKYTILTANGGLGGTTFDPAVVSNNSNLTATLSYDPNNVFLNVTLNFVTPNGPLSVNQQNVANTLTNFFNTTGSIPVAFAALSAQGLAVASGELGTGIIQSATQADNFFLNLLLDPTIAGRAGGFAPVGSTTGLADEDDEALAYAKKRLATKSERDAYAMARKAPALLAAQPASRWSVWGSAYGGAVNIDGNAVIGSNDLTARAWGVVGGADYRVTPNTLLGFALAGGGTNYSLANGLGRGSSDLFQAGVFGRHNFGPAYVSGALNYGWHDVTTNRTVMLAGVDQLQARFRAETFSGRFEGGYRYANPLLALTPYAAAQFTSVRLPGYAEQVLAGAGTFALTYAGQTTTATRTELGLRTDKSYAMQDGMLTLRGRVAWAHDYNNDGAITAVFQTLPGANFVVNGARPNPDAALVSAGAEMKWLNGFSLAGTFEGEFSGNYQSYAGKGVAKYSW